MKSKYESVKSHVRRHKVCLTLGAVAVSVIYLQSKGIQSMNKFLVDNDLYNKYYYPEGEI